MRGTIALTCALLLGLASAQAAPSAQPKKGSLNPDTLATHRNSMPTSKAGGVTTATVGDPDSFGRDKTYLGVASTEQVHLHTTCAGVSGPCIVLNPQPAATSVDETGLASIELPKNATNSLICFSVRPIAQWNWTNTTGSPQSALMGLRPRVTIENPVLADPSLGLGGSIEFTLTTFYQQRTIDPGESDFQIRETSRDCVGGLISKRNLMLGYGLSARQVRDFFRSPTTISFGLVGSVAMVSDGIYFYGIRLYGD